MMYLVGRCPNCCDLVPVCKLPSAQLPVFDPTLCVVLLCPSCGKEFRLLASLLDPIRKANGEETFPDKQ